MEGHRLVAAAEGGDAVIRLTKEEKAARYDALQAAIRQTRTNYEAWRIEALRKYESYGADLSPFSAYNKGLADAYGAVVEMLERWSDG